MLKIKDRVSIKILEGYGFKPKYDEDTGDITAYVYINKEQPYFGLKASKQQKTIRVFKKAVFKKVRVEEWRINPHNDLFDIDMLYELIKLGIIEKVEE